MSADITNNAMMSCHAILVTALDVTFVLMGRTEAVTELNAKFLTLVRN